MQRPCYAQLIPHEDIPAPKRKDNASTILGPRPQAGRNPAAFVRNGAIIPRPALPPRGNTTDAIRSDSKTTEWKADYHTGADPTLHYRAIFDPSVVPFKRVSVLNSVRSDQTLYASTSARRELVVGGPPSPDREQFWGSLEVRLQTGIDVPIPSVSPDMRILSYEAVPTTALLFSKDNGDNYYLRSEETGVSGVFRITFLADAASSYFAATVPRNYRVGDLAKLKRASPVPSSLQKSAQQAHRLLSVSQSTPLSTALHTLVRYFRAFRPGVIATPSTSVYWDLFHSQMGVCRHRSFAFMITANTLGIPTRYVSNEAHAWVEVWLPEQHWIRVDLGGAALRMEVHDAQNKRIRPRGKDPFPTPANYSGSYTLLEGDVAGLSPQQIAQQTGATNPPTQPPTLPPSPPPQTSFPPPKIDQVDRVGFRGERIQIHGSFATSPPPGISISLYLAPIRSEQEQRYSLGQAQMHSSKEFSATVVLPINLPLGDYEVFATSP